MACSILGILVILFTALFLTNAESKFGTWPDTCIGNHAKDAPSEETEELPACQEYQDFSCCTAETARFLQQNGTLGMRVITPVCGEFSPECAKYQLAQGCFYQCEPMLQHFQHPNRSAWTYQAPICASYCNEWFEACKDDLTCVGNWEEGPVHNPNAQECPADGSTCITYTEMYGDGKGLCDTLSPTAIKYEESDKDCFVGMFSGENPNLHGDPYGKNSAKKVTASLLPMLLLYFHL